jgi:hypothetical protein
LEANLKRKRRRNSSVGKESEEKMLPSDINKKINLTEVLDKQPNKTVHCIDRILYVNHEFKTVRFKIVLTKQRLLIFKHESGKLKFTIEIKNIPTLNVSQQTDNFLAIRTKMQEDVLIVARKKILLLKELPYCY